MKHKVAIVLMADGKDRKALRYGRAAGAAARHRKGASAGYRHGRRDESAASRGTELRRDESAASRGTELRRDESRLYKRAIIVRRRTAGSRERPARGGRLVPETNGGVRFPAPHELKFNN